MRIRYAILGAILILVSVKTVKGENVHDPNTDAFVAEFYNNFVSIQSNKAVKEKIERLIEKHPQNPHLYGFWASVEWTLIGRELGLKANEVMNISKNQKYAQRLTIYKQMLERGFNQVENDNLLEAVLLFERGKLEYRFLGDLRGADKTSAEIVRKLSNESSCHKYFFLGSIRFSMSTQGKIQQFAIYMLSENYKELQKLDNDVFSKDKSMEWLELAYKCPYDALSRKIWIDNAFFLISAYEIYKKNLSVRGEMPVLEKEIRVSSVLTAMFPQNTAMIEKHNLVELRHKTLSNYLKR